jgi:glutamine amidotransferase
VLVIVDYGLGNLGSIKNMLRKIGVDATVSGETSVIESAAKLVLPGVGAFDHGMESLGERGLIDVLNVKRGEGTPILGICLGMQLLTKGSEEGTLPGLGWIDARAVRFRSDGRAEKFTVPFMGWNYVRVSHPCRLFEDLTDRPRFYFVHSYYVQAADQSAVIATSRYEVEYAAAIESENVVGVQFHPEKSHRYGMKLLTNFASRY